MDVRTVAAFWAVSFLLVLTPGADWAYAITAGLRDRVVAPAVTGMLAGHLTHTLLVAAGVGALVSRAPVLLTVVTVAGAGYLVWLGITQLTHPASVRTDGDAPAGTAWAWAVRGWGVSGLNPKVLLLFLALLPQFTSAAAPWSQPAQILLLGGAHILSCAVVYTIIAVTAHRVLRARPTAARAVSRVSGLVMIGLGALIVVEQLSA